MTGEQRGDSWAEAWPVFLAQVKRRQRRREARRMIIAIVFFVAVAHSVIVVAWASIIAVASLAEWFVGR